MKDKSGKVLKNKIISFGFVLLILFSAISDTRSIIQATTEASNSDLELRMTVEKAVIVIGEEVNITLTLRNVGTSNITIVFGMCQKFDVLMFNESFCSSWSDGKYFCMLVTEILLGPGEEFSQTLQWNFYWFNRTNGEYISPSPGCYHLRGVCVGRPVPEQEMPWAYLRICLVPKVIDGWAVVLEMNNFPEGWSSCPSMNFTNSETLVQTLLHIGWRRNCIYVKRDNLTISVVKEAVEWLVSNVQFGDIALLYVFTHGSWMRKMLSWNEWFPSYWKEVKTPRRVLMIDTCSAGEFIIEALNDPQPHISLAHCSAGEVAWAGIPEEGLPIMGSVWNYYFTNALCNSTADSDGNGFVSVEEAFNFSIHLVQKYMNETVFAVPEFLEMYHDIGIFPENYDVYPHPVMDDQFPEQLYLNLYSHGLSADLNNDGVVDIFDIFIAAKAFGSHGPDIPNPRDPPSQNWNETADLNKDGWVNIIDIQKIAREFGKKSKSFTPSFSN